MERLSSREIECVQLAGEGLRDGQIATRLNLSTRTVSNHLQSARRKLGVSSRVEAARLLKDYLEQDLSMVGGRDAPPHAGVLGGVAAAGDRRTLTPYELYVRMGELRKPPRWGGTRLGVIVLWAMIGMGLIGAGMGLLTVFVSVDRVAEDVYSTQGASTR